MSIKKYLENVHVPDTPPGPFSVRLKYELKKEFFERKRSWYPAFATAFASVMFLLIMGFVARPDIAHNLHYVLVGEEEQPIEVALEDLQETELDTPEPFLTDEDIYLANQRIGNVSVVGDSTQGEVAGFPHLDEGKSYIIRRGTDEKKGNVYYISEVKKLPKMY